MCARLTTTCASPHVAEWAEATWDHRRRGPSVKPTYLPTTGDVRSTVWLCAHRGSRTWGGQQTAGVAASGRPHSRQASKHVGTGLSA